MSDTQKLNGTLDDKSVLLVVQFHKLGNTRKVNPNRIEVNADKTMLHVNKSLMDSPEYDAIRKHDGQTRAWLMTRALPSLFKEGVYRVPNTLVVDVDEYLGKASRERAKLVENFRSFYRMRVNEAKERLNGLFNDNDYLTADDAASRFSLTWKYVTMNTPDSLKNLREGLFEREKEKITKMVEEANEEIRQVLRVQMAALVQRMITQLQPTADGKKRKIYDSLTGNIDDFLNTFNARNLTGDAQLQELVGKARKVLKGVDADILRNDFDARVNVRDGFAEINKTLDAMIIDKPDRKFDFGGE